MSNRLLPIDTEAATGQLKEQLQLVKSKFGMIPNTLKIMAQSPAALEAYMSFDGALVKGVLPKATREAVSLAVSQFNGCEYCVSAHTLTGKLAGLTPDQIIRARKGKSEDLKTQAVLNLTTNVLERHGNISNEQLEESRKAGLSDAEIVEVIGTVTIMIMTNYLNNVAQTAVDFPKVSLSL